MLFLIINLKSTPHSQHLISPLTPILSQRIQPNNSLLNQRTRNQSIRNYNPPFLGFFIVKVKSFIKKTSKNSVRRKIFFKNISLAKATKTINYYTTKEKLPTTIDSIFLKTVALDLTPHARD